jgi:hypothetical protein
MVGDILACGSAGYFCLLYNKKKVVPLGVTEKPLQITGISKFHIIGQASGGFEVLNKFFDQFFFHPFSPLIKFG